LVFPFGWSFFPPFFRVTPRFFRCFAVSFFVPTVFCLFFLFGPPTRPLLPVFFPSLQNEGFSLFAWCFPAASPSRVETIVGLRSFWLWKGRCTFFSSFLFQACACFIPVSPPLFRQSYPQFFSIFFFSTRRSLHRGRLSFPSLSSIPWSLLTICRPLPGLPSFLMAFFHNLAPPSRFSLLTPPIEPRFPSPCGLLPPLYPSRAFFAPPFPRCSNHPPPPRMGPPCTSV